VLLLILGYFLATAVLDYGTVVSICTAIIVIGLSNGSFAGAAIAEAAQTLTRQTGVYVPLPTVLRHSATQITGFAVNAARASAVASFIGTPELLTALTDITSVTTEKRTTFTILLLFYMAVVMIVVWLAGILTRRIPAQESAA
jgi:ABC-type amino acid transport system permease subunit